VENEKVLKDPIIPTLPGSRRDSGSVQQEKTKAEGQSHQESAIFGGVDSGEGRVLEVSSARVWGLAFKPGSPPNIYQKFKISKKQGRHSRDSGS